MHFQSSGKSDIMVTNGYNAPGPELTVAVAVVAVVAVAAVLLLAFTPLLRKLRRRTVKGNGYFPIA
jgi:hypothetical protein